MMTRREALRVLGSGSAGAWLATTQAGLNFLGMPSAFAAAKDEQSPTLAPGSPRSAERIALIYAFTKKSVEVINGFEASTCKNRLGDALPVIPAGGGIRQAASGFISAWQREGRQGS